MKKVLILLSIIIVSCNSPKKEEKKTIKEWTLKEVIKIDGINPIGIALKGEELWLSDSDHNRLVQIDTTGNIIKTVNDFDRPMHIDANTTSIYVPQYGIDTVTVLTNNTRKVVPLQIELDAPAGVSTYKDELAIVDFYNNQIHYNNGNQWSSFGSEGNANGQFYYPTDVQITSNEIWVADAYNHRVQVFDKKGVFVRAIAWDQGINAATGIFVSKDEVFVTDFENDRVLIFDHKGVLKQELKDKVNKPTDMIIKENILYTLNYRQSTINAYVLESVLKK
ncbi:NHL repeat-containing protein [Winogradskyella immobilis]|uniref:NHL repeat-containing protein n=1 Tax=Winogradskyella immobilis TaxID=2816852 RepID=A0ABS8EN45_9FLAO|nr:hypothetical protein [Winogradskyella immobilis]MCC1483995.1 hypothetical protein [Winogradskyella immobilis]MCG0016087.1 hypothetical protein [Winogradskyella immobilis]